MLPSSSQGLIFVFLSIAMTQRTLLRSRELCYKLMVVVAEKVEAMPIDLNEE